MSTGEGFRRKVHCRTLCLEALVGFFHNAQSRVTLKVLGPHRDEHQGSIPDFLMSILYDEKKMAAEDRRSHNELDKKGERYQDKVLRTRSVISLSNT
jgi:hypothetical protein